VGVFVKDPVGTHIYIWLRVFHPTKILAIASPLIHFFQVVSQFNKYFHSEDDVQAYPYYFWATQRLFDQ